MGVPVLIMGASGSGKSASLRNFKAEEVGVFNVAGKPLPFKSQIKCFNSHDYKKITDELKKNNLKTYVIDDAQYLMAFEQLSRAKEIGYTKYTEIALNFTNLVQTVILNTSPDTVVYFLQHTERGEDNRVKAKTVGKLIDNWITLEGLFSIVLMADIENDGKHVFITQSDGFTTCKSPMGMFPEKIDNDLNIVNQTIRNYYEMDKKEK